MWARETSTGAAGALLEVKTAAAGTGCPSAVATRARSRASPGLMPQCTPLATNPFGRTTLIVRPRSRDSSCGLAAAAHAPTPFASRRRKRRTPSWAGPPSRVHPDRGEAGGLGEADQDVGALDGLARRPLHEVVEGAEHDHPAGAGIGAGGE